MLPPFAEEYTLPTVMLWQRAQVTPTLSPAYTLASSISSLPFKVCTLRAAKPTTALASSRATSAAGSLSSGALAVERSVLASAMTCARWAAGTFSMSMLTPAASAATGVKPVASMPCGRRKVRVQKPSLPKVSKRKTACPSAARPRGGAKRCGALSSGPGVPGKPSLVSATLLLAPAPSPSAKSALAVVPASSPPEHAIVLLKVSNAEPNQAKKPRLKHIDSHTLHLPYRDKRRRPANRSWLRCVDLAQFERRAAVAKGHYAAIRH